MKKSNKFIDYVLAKIKRFIYLATNIVFTPLANAKTLKENLMQLRVEDLRDEPETVIEAVVSWAIDTIVYGTSYAFVFASIFIFTGWLQVIAVPFALGILRWLWIDIVSETRKAIKNG